MLSPNLRAGEGFNEGVRKSEQTMSKEIPGDRLFSKEHEWIKIADQEALIGITDHAQASLGDVVYVELPEIGTTIIQGKPIGVVESVKAVSDIFAPISGTIKAINQAVLKTPEKINSDPYGEGWLLVVEPSNKTEEQNLLDSHHYQELLKKEAK